MRISSRQHPVAKAFKEAFACGDTPVVAELCGPSVSQRVRQGPRGEVGGFPPHYRVVTRRPDFWWNDYGVGPPFQIRVGWGWLRGLCAGGESRNLIPALCACVFRVFLPPSGYIGHWFDIDIYDRVHVPRRRTGCVLLCLSFRFVYHPAGRWPPRSCQGSVSDQSCHPRKFQGSCLTEVVTPEVVRGP